MELFNRTTCNCIEIAKNWIDYLASSPKTLLETQEKARKLGGQADELMAEAEALKGAARLEDLHIWQMQKVKTTKKGKTTYGYWMASWREGGKVRNIHLGSCAKMDKEAAHQKAREKKMKALGISV